MKQWIIANLGFLSFGSWVVLLSIATVQTIYKPAVAAEAWALAFVIPGIFGFAAWVRNEVQDARR